MSESAARSGSIPPGSSANRRSPFFFRLGGVDPRVQIHCRRITAKPTRARRAMSMSIPHPESVGTGAATPEGGVGVGVGTPAAVGVGVGPPGVGVGVGVVAAEAHAPIVLPPAPAIVTAPVDPLPAMVLPVTLEPDPT